VYTRLVFREAVHRLPHHGFLPETTRLRGCPCIYPHILAWINGLSTRTIIILSHTQFACAVDSTVVLGGAPEELRNKLYNNYMYNIYSYIYIYIHVIYTLTLCVQRVWSSVNRSPSHRAAVVGNGVVL